MKKKIIGIVLIILFLAILFFPFKTDSVNDGGTRVFSALTYKIVKWHKSYDYTALGNNPQIYKSTRLYFLPNNLKDLDLLWESEKEEFYKETFGEAGMGDNKKLQIVKIESDIEGVDVILKDYALDGEKPYIELCWKNQRDEEYCFGEYCDIYYSKDKNARFPDGFETCAASEICFTDLGYILNPKSEYVMKYDLSGYNLSRNEGIYCMTVDRAYPLGSEEKYIRVFFELE